ncbi:hypothetical protein Lfu02_78050 [Longispora fulva]|nr:hypothetical protein Lfu02_78050 [Longispora fulva]
MGNRCRRVKATNMPSWAKGERMRPDETPGDATKRIFKEHGMEIPPKNLRGPGSEWSQTRKGITRA